MTSDDTHHLVLENDWVRRELLFEPGKGLRTLSLLHKKTGTEFARTDAGGEFLLGIDGQTLFGYKKPSVHVLDGEMQKSAYSLEWMGREEHGSTLRLRFWIPEADAQLCVCYSLGCEGPEISKWLELTAGSRPLTLDKCYFEVLNAYPGALPEVEFFTRQGLERANWMFVTQGFDDVVQMHNSRMEEGCFIANEAPGPLKRFLVYPQWPDTAICVGYNSDTAPFRKYLRAGDTFVSHASLLAPYRGRRDCPEVRNTFRSCLRRRLPEYQNDAFMYCTWIPFLKNIDEPLLFDLAERAAALGATTFVVDDGWFTEGGWRVDRVKFPRGLEPLARKIRALGMRFGLWFNIGTDYGNRGAHTEDHSLDATGGFTSSGFVPGNATKCMASAHSERMANTLIALAQRYQAGYFKLDFSSIISPYGLLPLGCHSREHAGHRDGLDALFEQYAGMKKIRDRVKAVCPDVMLDFSFECFGGDWPSLAALQYSELHHCSNLNTLNEASCSALTIRNVLYRFCTLMPVERILGSLICLQGAHALENLFTAFAGSPLLAGDLRTLPKPVAAQITKVFRQVKAITASEPLTEFVKLRGDAHIQPWDWDGFARFTRKGQGLAFLFRNACGQTPLLAIDLPRQGEITFVDLLTEEAVFTAMPEALGKGIPLSWPELGVIALRF